MQLLGLQSAGIKPASTLWSRAQPRFFNVEEAPAKVAAGISFNLNSTLAVRGTPDFINHRGGFDI
jgi:hypothetical protein